MAYVRFSSDDWKSDVYVYADVRGGWTTHVAARRYEFVEEMPPPVGDDIDTTTWLNRWEKVEEIRQRSKMVNIELDYAGEMFHDLTPGACAGRLVELAGLGYHVPDGVIESLREEQAEMDEAE